MVRKHPVGSAIVLPVAPLVALPVAAGCLCPLTGPAVIPAAPDKPFSFARVGGGASCTGDAARVLARPLSLLSGLDSGSGVILYPASF